MRSHKKRFTARNILFMTATIGLVSLAVNEQLQRPPDERTWQGSIFGLPYDFRFPTFRRTRSTLWNKDNPQLLVPKVFGMGWDINFYPLFHPREI
ncbi:MAG: hypothetical protein PVS3B3_18130 [Ktedonobacteraceae bacterium]